MLVTFSLVSILVTKLPILIAQDPQIDLIGPQTTWQPFAGAFVSQNQSSLNILVVSNYTGDLWNRAYLPIRITAPNSSNVLFELGYVSKSYVGNATFFAEIRDNSSNAILWDNILNNTNGKFVNQTFNLPQTILNSPVEFRLYIITHGPGEHALSINNSLLSFSNVTRPIEVTRS